jgi:hypothetical protein
MLDPLLLKLAQSYSDHADLSHRLRKLFTVSRHQESWNRMLFELYISLRHLVAVYHFLL